MEQLLEVAGPPDNRYWRPKWAGLDDNGKDLYPDLGKGDGNVSEFGWQPERNLIGSEHVRGLMTNFGGITVISTGTAPVIRWGRSVATTATKFAKASLLSICT